MPLDPSGVQAGMQGKHFSSNSVIKHNFVFWLLCLKRDERSDVDEPSVLQYFCLILNGIRTKSINTLTWYRGQLWITGVCH